MFHLTSGDEFEEMSKIPLPNLQNLRGYRLYGSLRQQRLARTARPVRCPLAIIRETLLHGNTSEEIALAPTTGEVPAAQRR